MNAYDYLWYAAMTAVLLLSVTVNEWCPLVEAAIRRRGARRAWPKRICEEAE